MMTYVAMGTGALVWMVAGYSLAFAPGSAFLGGLKWLGLSGVGTAPEPDYAATVPHLAFFVFQGMFATITPALINLPSSKLKAFADGRRFVDVGEEADELAMPRITAALPWLRP